MDVLLQAILDTGKEKYKVSTRGKLSNNKLVFNDDYNNIFDIENLILERESSDIHSIFDYKNNKVNYFIKKLNNDLDIKMKVTNKVINDNEIIIEYNINLEEETKCKYSIKWRVL